MILVTGAGGNVGAELVKKLRGAGVKFRAGYYSATKAEEAKRTGVDGVALDFAKPETLRPALRGVDKVFLISGNVPRQDELEMNVVREAKRDVSGRVGSSRRRRDENRRIKSTISA